MKEFMQALERSGYVPPELAPYELNDPFGERLRMEAFAIGPTKLLIPVINLQGTQTADGYSSHKGKRAERAIISGGMDFLLQYPIITTAVFTNGIANIYVEDGHHRGIKANKHGIHEVPSLVLTLDQMAQIRRRITGKPNEPKKVGLDLIMESCDAVQSFQVRGVRSTGESVLGVANMSDLKQKFASF